MLIGMALDPITAVVVVANLLGGAMALPQAFKLVRSRRVDGVSPVWAGISASVNGWWAAYGWATGDFGIVPVSAVSVMAYLAIAGCLVRFGPAGAGRTAATIGTSVLVAAVVPLLPLATGGWVATGIVLGALYGVQLTPAVVAVHRAPDVSGVSAATWGLAFLEAGLWGVYGVARLDAGLISLAVTGLTASALVLARLFVRRPQRGGALGLAPV